MEKSKSKDKSTHTKPNLSPFSRCGIWYIFCNIEQYHDKFATKEMWYKIYCLFISFSLISPSVSSLSHHALSCLSFSACRPHLSLRPRRGVQRRGDQLVEMANGAMNTGLNLLVFRMSYGVVQLLVVLVLCWPLGFDGGDLIVAFGFQ